MITPDQIDVKQEYLRAYDDGGGSRTGRIASLLACIANNPIEPTELEGQQICKGGLGAFHNYGQQAAVEWQRRMFLKREPELPEEVLGLLTRFNALGMDEVNKRVRKAYELGLKNGGSK